MQNNHLISVIVPVYNVERYLDSCIESIIHQTYTNLEIILINDGSNDGSERICLKWAKLDERIIYIYKRNETLGPTRNLGIQVARGDYIVFVDSDDWIASTFIEKLYRCVAVGNRDFARCNYYRVTKNGKTLVSNNEYYCREHFDVHKMIGSVQAITIWTGLYKKNLWTEHDIKMPAGPHQDLAILGLIFIYAKSAGVCQEGLYYYREDREGNTTQKVKGGSSVLDPLKHLVAEYRRRGLFAEYKDDLLQACIGQLNTSIDRFVQRKSDTAKCDYKAAIKAFFKSEFSVEDSFFNNKMAALGCYDLQRVLSKVHYNDKIREYKYQHSSIISIMSEEVDIPIGEILTYKDKMIKADGSKKLRNALADKEIDYILIDFMEERYDILDFGRQRYLTYSDALKEKRFLSDNIRIIRRNSDECRRLWEDSCIRFIRLLQEYVSSQKIFLVKFYLAEEYGECGKECQYKDIEQIRGINNILHGYYNYFEKNCCGINVIRLNPKYWYTNRGLQYGCYPWHLNSNAQYDVQNKINRLMKGGEKV